jgi:hypothetical protein
MPERDLNALETEIERLKRNCADRSRGREFSIGTRWNASHTEVEFVYRSNQLICDRDDLDDVLAALDNIGQARPMQTTDGPVGLAVLDVGDRDAADLADQLAELLGDDVVTPNHVLDVKGIVNFWPATEPVPWEGQIAELGEPVGPGRPKVAIVDTGYLESIADESGYERFKVVDPESEPDDEVYSASNIIRPYGGHGTASAARLLSVSGADAVSVHVRDSLVGGAVDEITIVEDLVASVERGVDIISIPAGMYTPAGRSPHSLKPL